MWSYLIGPRPVTSQIIKNYRTIYRKVKKLNLEKINNCKLIMSYSPKILTIY